MRTATSRYLHGAACAIAAVSIWAGWSVVTRLAVTTGLDAWDVAALRFGVAGLLLAPVVARRGLALDRLGWHGLAVLVVGAGAPYVLVAADGLRFAPARDLGVLNPGVMPLFVALIARLVLREKLPASRRWGLWLILAGAAVVVGWHAVAWNDSRPRGQAMFLCAAFMWASFTVVMRRARLEPLHATAIVCTGSLIVFLPAYVLWHGVGVARVAFADVAVQAMFQGVLVAIVSLLLYARAIDTLGAPAGAAFGALTPALSALFAIPLLDEWPGASDWLGILLVSAGVYLATGAPKFWTPTKSIPEPVPRRSDRPLISLKNQVGVGGQERWVSRSEADAE